MIKRFRYFNPSNLFLRSQLGHGYSINRVCFSFTKNEWQYEAERLPKIGLEH